MEERMLKRLEIAAIFAVVAMVFVGLVFHMLSRQSDAPTPGPKLPEVALRPEAPARATSLAKTFLAAAIAQDFAAFKNACFKEGDGQMKLFAAQPATKEMFRRAAESISACRQGYELEYLTSMKQQGSEVFLWKLVPRAGEDQFLVRLTLKDGKVSGFFFQ